MDCPFCDFLKKEKEKVLLYNKSATLIPNFYPATHRHILAIPIRHITKLTEPSETEINDLFELVWYGARIFSAKFPENGLTVHANFGEIAGQTKAHLHIHLLPRYPGDGIKDLAGYTDFISLFPKGEADRIADLNKQEFLNFSNYIWRVSYDIDNYNKPEGFNILIKEKSGQESFRALLIMRRKDDGASNFRSSGQKVRISEEDLNGLIKLFKAE